MRKYFTSSSISFHFTLSYHILFYSSLLDIILSYIIQSHLISTHLILSYPNSSHLLGHYQLACLTLISGDLSQSPLGSDREPVDDEAEAIREGTLLHSTQISLTQVHSTSLLHHLVPWRCVILNLYCIEWFSIIVYSTIANCSVLYHIVLCHVVLYCIEFHCIRLFCIPFYCTLLCSVNLIWTVLYCAVLYCTIPIAVCLCWWVFLSPLEVHPIPTHPI